MKIIRDMNVIGVGFVIIALITLYRFPNDNSLWLSQMLVGNMYFVGALVIKALKRED